MCSREFANATTDPTGRAKLADAAGEIIDFPALRLTEIFRRVGIEGQPSEFRQVIREHWSKISLLAHQIHDEEMSK